MDVPDEFQGNMKNYPNGVQRRMYYIRETHAKGSFQQFSVMGEATDAVKGTN